MSRYVPGHNVGATDQGFTGYERPHFANRAGRWMKPPHRPRTPHAPTRPVHQKVVDPFAPETEDQTRLRARQLVEQELGPILQQIQAAIEARSKSGQAAIQGYTGELGHLWSGIAPATGQYYDTARGQQSQVNSEVANRLGSVGQALGSEIGNKISYAPEAVQKDIAGGAATTAQGVANANFTKGSAGLEALIAEGAAAKAYGAQMPGIAGLTGLQSSKQLQAQLNSDLAKQLGDARSQAEGSYSSIYERERDRELQKAIASQSGLQNQEKIHADQQYKQQQLKYKQAKDRYDRALKLQQLGISQERVNQYAHHNGISERQAEQRLLEQARADRAREKQAQRTLKQRQAENRWRHNHPNAGKGGHGGRPPGLHPK